MMTTEQSKTLDTPAELSHLVRRPIFGLFAHGDGDAGWGFHRHSRSLFERREDAEAYIPTFTAACCKEGQINSPDPKSLKVTVVSWYLYSQPTGRAKLKDGDRVIWGGDTPLTIRVRPFSPGGVDWWEALKDDGRWVVPAAKTEKQLHALLSYRGYSLRRDQTEVKP
jgi:hypothetical protein